MQTVISREIQFDYGHTLPSHYGFCNQLHGHRGKLIAFFSGELTRDASSSENGMVMDFSAIKDILNQYVKDKIDHAFAIWKNESADEVFIPEYRNGEKVGSIRITTLEFVKIRNKKVLILDDPPTAEVLVDWAYREICKGLEVINYNRKNKITLESVQWHETPNNIAIRNSQ